MPIIEIPPNDPKLFGQLVEGVTLLTATSTLAFSVDTVNYAYPDNPDNLFTMGDDTFRPRDAQSRKVDGQVMAGNSTEPDDLPRIVMSYLFEEPARQRYGLIGELAIYSMLEVIGPAHTQLDLYWLEQTGTVWTRLEMEVGGDQPLAHLKRGAKRRLADFELEILDKVVRGTTPNW